MKDPFVPSPDDIGPMPPDVFRDAFLFAHEIASGRVPDQIRSPSDFHIVDEEKGREYSLADIPLNRFGMAIAQRFSGDDAAMKSFMWRFFALQAVIDEPVLERFIRRPNSSTTELHPAVIRDAATEPLGDGLKFDVQIFSAKVERMAAIMEAE